MSYSQFPWKRIARIGVEEGYGLSGFVSAEVTPKDGVVFEWPCLGDNAVLRYKSQEFIDNLIMTAQADIDQIGFWPFAHHYIAVAINHAAPEIPAVNVGEITRKGLSWHDAKSPEILSHRASTKSNCNLFTVSTVTAGKIVELNGVTGFYKIPKRINLGGIGGGKSHGDCALVINTSIRKEETCPIKCFWRVSKKGRFIKRMTPSMSNSGMIFGVSIYKFTAASIFNTEFCWALSSKVSLVNLKAFLLGKIQVDAHGAGVSRRFDSVKMAGGG